MMESPASDSRSTDSRFLDHLSSAADLVAAHQFRDAEGEVERALSLAPADLRALKLLALVRFKLGRLEEARTVCRQLAEVVPDDSGIRLKLGLIALKLDRVDDAVSELELCARLAPDDIRAWNYLGFAYARRGERGRAAAAFRRAGQEGHAAEMEQLQARAAPGPDAAGAGLAPVGHSGAPSFTDLEGTDTAFDMSAPVDGREPRTDPDRFLTAPPGGYSSIPVAPLVGYAVSRLAPAADQAAWVGATVRLPIGEEIFVRADAAVACSGTARWEAAHRRAQGRAAPERLGGSGGADGPPFFRVTGRGDLFVGAPRGRLVPLLLEDDILYIRQDRVLAFEGTVAWEYGHVPRGGVRMLQFRGRGVVAICIDGEPGAVKVSPERPLMVAMPHLLGWIGRVVACGIEGSGQGDAPPLITPPMGISCEGEGVVLVDVVGEGGDGEGQAGRRPKNTDSATRLLRAGW